LGSSTPARGADHPQRSGTANPRTSDEPNPSRGWAVGGIGLILVVTLVVVIMLIAMAILWAM
jgi:uncharacterized protein DUF6480